MLSDILNMVKKHETWREKQCINLIPSENVMSDQVRSLLSSKLAQRYTAPDHFYMGTRFIDEIEEYGEKIARRLFRANIADLRPLSGHIADLIFLASFSKKGDTLMCVSADDGGYPGIWKKGLPKPLGLRIKAFPFSKEERNIRLEAATEVIERLKPNLIILGASFFLFPHPAQKIAQVAKMVGAHIGFDGSHVMGLIAGGQFQDPLREGVPALFGSTHKSFFGPQGGIILADKDYGEVMKEKIHPTLVDNAHWNRITSMTLALAEMRKFGKAYSRQVIRNAHALAKALYDHKLPVVGSTVGFTKSHQILMDFGGYKQGRKIAEQLERENIIVDCGVRLGTSEITRLGMKENEMEQIAELLKQVILDEKEPGQVKQHVEKIMKEFQDLKYCFY
jgi:glycine hydroxymethyltransferase